MTEISKEAREAAETAGLRLYEVDGYYYALGFDRALSSVKEEEKQHSADATTLPTQGAVTRQGLEATPAFQRTHFLKCWPVFFNDILNGRKTFEGRVDDRGFHVGDTLELYEFDPKGEGFTDRCCEVLVTYIAREIPSLPSNYVIMSVELAQGVPLTATGATPIASSVSRKEGDVNAKGELSASVPTVGAPESSTPPVAPLTDSGSGVAEEEPDEHAGDAGDPSEYGD